MVQSKCSKRPFLLQTRSLLVMLGLGLGGLGRFVKNAKEQVPVMNAPAARSCARGRPVRAERSHTMRATRAHRLWAARRLGSMARDCSPPPPESLETRTSPMSPSCSSRIVKSLEHGRAHEQAAWGKRPIVYCDAPDCSTALRGHNPKVHKRTHPAARPNETTETREGGGEWGGGREAAYN
ncbi:hypothetical protein T492DRAFT_834165 [Pavlovales sp. CCMP2436]|nr:hypothetical protein T492DRAFT_834165 [Pavlovales sp. CCMP2436]